MIYGVLSGRCGITFLPIREPDHVKKCSICDREFLNERRHPELVASRNVTMMPTSDTFHDPEGLTNASEAELLDEKHRSSHTETRKRQRSTNHPDQPFFATYMLQFFDHCPYCGGKFYTKA